MSGTLIRANNLLFLQKEYIKMKQKFGWREKMKNKAKGKHEL